MQLLGVGGVAVGMYAGIRADLAALHVKADHAWQSAKQAHRRIDDLWDKEA
jgi:hypothetical protein